ncbi:MAG: F0F1 ATP synthase subunit delta [Methylococcaceae bacterium]
MLELRTLARPYAEAVFKRSKETSSAAEWSEMLRFLASLVKNEQLLSIIENPRISNEKLQSLLIDICAEHISKEGENFIRLLLQNNRLKLIPYVQTLFEEFRADDEGYLEVTVQSAFSLDAQQVKKLSTKLKNVLEKEVRLNVEIDKSLIGGILVRAGDRVIDGSVKGQLQQLAKIL